MTKEVKVLLSIAGMGMADGWHLRWQYDNVLNGDEDEEEEHGEAGIYI